MVVGMVADRIAILVSVISLDAVAVTVMTTDGNVDAVIATAIGTTSIGAAGGNAKA